MGYRLTPGAVLIADEDPRLAAVEALTLGGLMHDALGAAEAIGPLARFAGPKARCTAAWLLDHLGASQTARRWYAAEFKKDPNHAVVRYFYTFVLLNERGPVQAWLSLKDYEPSPAFTAEQRSEIWSLKARLLATLGEERRAQRELARCDPEALGRARFVSTQASLLQHCERRPEALAVLEAGLELEPLDRILVAHTALVLEAQNRREEALALLTRVEPSLQTPTLVSQRAQLEASLSDFAAEARSLDRYERLSLKADVNTRRSIGLRRAENCYQRGDFAGAANFGKAFGDEYWKKLSERLTRITGPAKRRVLELPISLQEPMGCAPTSIALVANHFGAGVDQVDVADEICYEGTAAHSERAWVEARGWLSREFTVDFATAAQLIERGVPFLLVTVQIASAHAQVVVGYDETRKTLITRDPSSPRLRELDADTLFEQHRAYGPRGHVLLPPDQLTLLEGLVLPEQDLHDLAHRVRLALKANHDMELEAQLQQLEARAPNHPLTLWAQRHAAARDQDPYAILASSLAILERFPDDANAELSVLGCLSSIGTEAEQRERIEKRLAKPEAPWVFYERLGELLSANAREHPRARRLITRALRRVPVRGRTLAAWARLEHNAGNTALARDLNRLAATLEPTDDDLARAHFEDAFSNGQPEEALLLLQDRVKRYGGRSSEPVRVLFTALEWLERIPEAFQALDAALETRPDDGPLLLFVADACARYRKRDRVEALLTRAKDRVSTAVFEQHAARIAEFDGDLARALKRFQTAHQTLPLSLHVNESIAQLLNELSGPSAAREFLTLSSRAYPSHCGLREMLIRWLRGHDPQRVLPELDALLALQPAHVWAKRERALVLSDLGEHERAIEDAQAALAMAPNQAASQRVLVKALTAAGQRAEALAPARRALELWPDAPGATSDCNWRAPYPNKWSSSIGRGVSSPCIA